MQVDALMVITTLNILIAYVFPRWILVSGNSQHTIVIQFRACIIICYGRVREELLRLDR